MSWGLAIALGMAALIALANALRLGLTRIVGAAGPALDGHGQSPSLLLSLHRAEEARP